MSNPHVARARESVKAANGQVVERANALLALAQVEATLALAYEQHTANLIAYETEYVTQPEFHSQVKTRLGIGDPK